LSCLVLCLTKILKKKIVIFFESCVPSLKAVFAGVVTDAWFKLCDDRREAHMHMHAMQPVLVWLVLLPW
jgi:Na+/glutamate symporter